MKFLGIILVFIVLFRSSWSSPNGAPESQCQTMTPGHGVAPQETPSPFVVLPEATIVGQGQMLQMMLLPSVSTHTDFKGFMIQARTDLDKIVGQFDVDKNVLAIALNCDSVNSTATHSSRVSKRTMVLEWKAPEDFVGKVHFQ